VEYYYAASWRQKDKFSCKLGRKNCEIRASLGDEYEHHSPSGCNTT